MRLSSAARLLAGCLVPGGHLDRRGVILLIGHMRCFSSLFGHLIGSHPQVAGYAEMHQKYRSSLDFIELASKVQRAEGRRLRGRYLFDKLLHGDHVRERVLRRRDVSVLLMARPPEPTVRSILRIAAGGINTASAAIDYYMERIQAMRQVLDRRAGRALYLDADCLIEDPSRVLPAVSDYLGLTPSISEEYRLFLKTGAPKYGDPSPWIRSGRIVRDRDGSLGPTVILPSRLSEANEAYREFREKCRQYAEVALVQPAPVLPPDQAVTMTDRPAARLG